ncbi:MAG: hypothetical protein A2138_24990 [Deltaproteobacteria bacterium RBG_16_71_12]|nr:MAG: hypothetical protein A2138_24990 [Deltaproteobacteria bacterium RBG_16_71_12]
MLGLSRNERLAASLRDGEAALAAAQLDRAHAAFAQAARLASELDARQVQGCALLGAARASLAQGDAERAALLAGDAIVMLELAGAPSDDALQLLGAASREPASVTVARALELAQSACRADDHATLTALGDTLLLRMLQGVSDDAVVQAGTELCMCAIIAERADLCARWMSAIKGALRSLAAAGLRPPLCRATDLMAVAIERADVEPLFDDDGPLEAADAWAFPLADLMVEVSNAALEPLRVARAHLVRARVLLDGGRAAEARTSARAAFGLARVLGLGDDDPLAAEAAALVVASDERAPAATA